MSIQEKFEKAVNVIRNLPKNGSYQPSHELQLRFYGYYKQATDGINCKPRPSFWDVVNRAKWDAWAKLGNMTKEEAMLNYIEELRKIVETMSYTDNVANFLNSLDNFYENVPPEDLELLVGPIIEKIRSRPDSPLSGSPLASRDTSPTRVPSTGGDPSQSHKHITSSLETSPASSYSASPLPPDTDDDEEEHFLDTQTEPDKAKDGSKKSRSEESAKELTVTAELLRPIANGSIPSKRGVVTVAGVGDGIEVPQINLSPSSIQRDLEQLKSRLHCVENTLLNQPKQMTCSVVEAANSSGQAASLEMTEVFKRAIENMTKEMENIQRRMNALENRKLAEGSVSRKRGVGGGPVVTRWWGLPLSTTAALLAWPLLLLLISKWMARRRHN